ncbi:DUF427 domain-containing protein [Actinotalea sp.]|uniref:DUF427 domain-containing protein n=1 Tax=Actinotalea sp. TaxID=1872145 RepID=UPI0035614579
MIVTAELAGVEIARSDRTVVVEGNHYFPPEDVASEHLIPTDTHTRCGWKGLASYWTVRAAGTAVVDGAWAYPDPSDSARQIKDHLAFANGITVREV